ncbi:MAG: carbohydrate-binding domain-containing protein [Gemmatimonadaceae bacterium]|nr:carbohydrate-binding domain-containing protein [Gemmatimonadaceae bacterium]
MRHTSPSLPSLRASIRAVPIGLLTLFSVAACSDAASTAPDDETSGGNGSGTLTTFSMASFVCSEEAKLTNAYTVSSAMATKVVDHEVVSDYTYDASTTTQLTFSGATITSSSADGVVIAGSSVTISRAGTYRLRGTLADGQVMVHTSDTGVVKLVLDGVSLSRSADAALFISKAKRAAIILASGSSNTITDGATYPAGVDQNAALFSKANLSIGGTGALTVTGRYLDGITGKDGLVIRSGTISVTAVDDGIRGKDYLVIRGGTFVVNAGGDAYKSDEEGDATLGYVLVSGGTHTLTARNDGIQAETDVLLSDGAFTIKTGGGATAVIADSISAKALKATRTLVVDGGTYSIDAADDGLHANANVVVNGGTFTVATADDGVHADSAFTINGGAIDVTRSYEGIEAGSADLTFNGGRVRVVSSDDGINLAGNGDTAPGRAPGNYTIRINGGRVVSTSGGDGIDANGHIAMSGGCLVVHGPTANNNAPVDYDGTFTMTGGYLVAAGSMGMAQAPGTTSTQPSLFVTFGSVQTANTVVHVADANGTSVLDFVPSRNFQSLVVSTPTLTRGSNYTLYLGGNASSPSTDGLFSSGQFTPSGSGRTLSLSSTVTRLTY